MRLVNDRDSAECWQALFPASTRSDASAYRAPLENHVSGEAEPKICREPTQKPGSAAQGRQLCSTRV